MATRKNKISDAERDRRAEQARQNFAPYNQQRRAAVQEKRARELYRDPTETEVLMATVSGRTVLTEEDLATVTQEPLIGVGTVSHRGPRTIRLYDKDGKNRHVPASTLAVALRNGLFVLCPICRGKHTKDGFNSCPGREPLMYTRCPVCAEHGRMKLIPDVRLGDNLSFNDDNDPNFVPLDIPLHQTPQERIKRRWEDHMLAVHPSEARSRGIRDGR